MSEHCGHLHHGIIGHTLEDAHPFALPGSTVHYAAERPVRVGHVAIDVELDFEQAEVSGTCTTTLTPVREISTVRFDAVDLDVSKVTVGGKKASFTNSGKHLDVTLPTKAAAGKAFDVEVTYSAKPTRGLYFFKPDNAYPDRPVQAWTQGQDEDSRCWFPCLDAPAQKATTEVKATFPAAFVALSNGKLVSDTKKGKLRTTHFRLEVPHSPYLVTLAVGALEETTAKAGKTTLRYLYPPGQKDDAMRVVGRTPEMIRRFEEITGRAYPYGSYAQVFVTDFIFGGMENTSATTLTDVVLHPAGVHQEYGASAEALIAHELAHQWFGDLLTCRDWPHGWLNEGFATYFEALWKEHGDGIDDADQGRREDLSGYLEESKGRYARAIVSRKFHEPIDLFDRHLYEKGGMVLHELRRRLGDDLFFAALKQYVKDHAQGNVETVDLARSIEKATGHNVDKFFDQYVFSPGHPALSVEVSHSAEDKLLKLDVKQTQKTDGDGALPIFELPLDVVLVVGGRERKERLLLRDKEHTFLLPCEKAPSQVRVDERREVLGTLEVKKEIAQWIEELDKAPFARSRTEAALALGKEGSRRAVEALASRLRKEKFWATQAAIARALGQARTPLAKATLLSHLDLAHPRARRAVMAALGEWKRDEEVVNALKRVCEKGDSSPFVQGEAARSLGKVRTEGVIPLLTKLTKKDSFQDVLAAGAIDGLAATQTREAFDVVEPLTRYGERQYVRRAAVLAVGHLGEAADRKSRAVEVLSELLRDPNFRVQMVVFDAITSMGDRRAVSALESTPFLDGRARRAAREAVRSLRADAPGSKELAALREELDQLKSETKGLKEQVETFTARKDKKK